MGCLLHGRPRRRQPTIDCGTGVAHIIGFSWLLTHTVSYATTHPITPPFWAHKSRMRCGVLGCCQKPTCKKCFGCGAHVLAVITLKCNVELDTTRELRNAEAVNPSS